MKNSRYYPLAIEALVELAPEIRAIESKALTIPPSLFSVLEELGSVPPGALFLGMADDGLPVLLNLFDSVPGSILVLGDDKAGKTSLLKNIAAVTLQMFDPRDLQFGVVTSSSEEWVGLRQSEHCAGVIPIYEDGAMDFILSLNAWAHANKTRQSVILLLDGLDKVVSWNANAVDDLRWLLMRGPSRRVWPIVSLNSRLIDQTKDLIPYFRTFIYGSIKDKRLSKAITKSENEELDELAAGIQFTMKEGNNWLRFWIPRLEEGD
jgi:hypothetical protein